MNAIAWNCRGLGNARAVRSLRDLVKSRKPNILFLIETLSKEDRIKHLCSSLGFEIFFPVDSCGRSGGLALLWDRSVQCDVFGHDSNHIDAQVTNNNNTVWRLTGFYGFSERSRRRDSWEKIRVLSLKSSMPWLLIGDYNDMLSEKDKKGTHKHPSFLLDGFKNVVEECGLLELDLIGGSFT